MKRYILLTLFMTVSLLNSKAPQFEIRIDTNNVKIGEEIRIDLKFNSHELAEELIIPDLPSQFPKEIEIYDSTLLDTIKNDTGISLSRSFIISSFEEGEYTLPEQRLLYRFKGFEDLSIIKTDSIVFNFVSVAVDTTQEIKDIKSTLEEPLSFAEILPYILIGIAVTLIVILLYRYLKKRKVKPIEEEKYDPKIPPHIFALEELKKLEEEKLWQKDKFKLYHSNMTEIIKLYIERRYEFNALESTTSDLLELMKNRLDNENYEKLTYILNIADMTKFAKRIPLPAENESVMKLAVEFVENTKIIQLSAPTVEVEEKKDV